MAIVCITAALKSGSKDKKFKCQVRRAHVQRKGYLQWICIVLIGTYCAATVRAWVATAADAAEAPTALVALVALIAPSPDAMLTVLADAAALANAQQLTGPIVPMPAPHKKEKAMVITDAMKSEDAHHKIRMARADYRLFGVRQRNRLVKEAKE